MISVYDKVKTLVEKNKIKEGTVGIVVSLYKDSLACEVEIWDECENPIDVVTYLQSEIEKIH